MDTRTTIRTRLLPWFAANKRTMPWRNRRTPYRVWISELMLQQTRVDQATPYFRRFMRRFPSLKSLAGASREDVLKMWEGLGYYSRARNLHKAAQIIAQQHGGRFPDSFDQIRALPGIGDYTAAAIGSLAFNLDVAVLDGNVIRVLSRLFAYAEDTRSSVARKELQRMTDALLVKGDAGNYNEAMMELGATVCLPRNPRCDACPVSSACRGFRSGRPADYPVQAPKKKVPHLVVGAAVVTNGKGDVLIAQRRDTDMLGGLWEFPGGKQEPDETIRQCIVRELKEELGINVEVGEFLTTVRHAYSHFTMDMHTYFARIRSGRPRPLHCQDYRWMPVSGLRSVPYSKADLKIITELERIDAKKGQRST
jgi:A/G-specific adenine glycosylase